jgi:hypothetical protein
MLSSGVMRAHIRTGGNASTRAVFDGLMSAKTMDAETLKSSLGSVGNFLQDYANQGMNQLDSGKTNSNLGSNATGGGKMLVFDKQGNIVSQ